MPSRKTRARFQHLLAGITLWIGVAAGGVAADVKVIANPSVKESAISAEDLRGVFMETKTTLADGSHVEPVLLESGATHEIFVKRFIGKSDMALATYYRSLVFAGRGLIPKSLSSEADVVRYVAKTKGALGYVSAAANLAGVKILDVR